jgi:hypothetical protein
MLSAALGLHFDFQARETLLQTLLVLAGLGPKHASLMASSEKERRNCKKRC